MSIRQEDKRHVEQIAEDALGTFEAVAETARRRLHDEHGIGPDTLAAVNTMTAGAAMRRLDQISQENRASYQILLDEPAIARVVAEDESGKRRIYYICRAAPPSGFENFASYRAPVGRLASLTAGDVFTFPNGNYVEILERALFRPARLQGGWDSKNTIIESDDFGPLTIESLRALLSQPGVAVPEELLDQLLAEEQLAANVIEGVRRSVITKMGLRDQPVLDQYQDEIFRLPLDKRLLILGPPGTGKTTTLIRRLGQKLDTAYLGEDEQHIVERIGSTNGVTHAKSWMMFTPTELLKQYLKEAFAREGVPASDLRIRTWQDYRRELARNTFGVLRTASGGGAFVLKDSAQNIKTESLEHSIEWFSDFNEWQRTAFLRDLHQSAERLSKEAIVGGADVGQRLLSILDRAAGNSVPATLGALAAEVSGVQAQVSLLRDGTDKKIKGCLNLQLNRDRDFLNTLATFIDGLQQAADADTDEGEDQDADEEDANLPSTGRGLAISAYMQSVRGQARAHAARRSLNKESRNGKIVEWLADRSLAQADLAEVGASLLVQTYARRFVNPVKRYVQGIPRRYRAFRRVRQEEAKWYAQGPFSSTDLHPLELDIVLLAILRSGGELLSRPEIFRDIAQPAWSALKPILGLYTNQILVDEATDFSPVQMACMAGLCHPQIRSFFACGDFNQRLTTWGSRSIDEMKWIVPDVEVKTITVSYRQSRQLNELARAIIRAAGESDQNVTLPEHVDSEGVAPVLMEYASQTAEVVTWLAERIREIERFVTQLPSTAIFVNEESQVQTLADALNDILADYNIRVVACPQGQVMGRDNDVRVFAVEHIKGLEFEAVFFIGIDRLADLHPQLFDKYLYVGTTRAATYLGVTCQDVLPPAISGLRSMFVPVWDTTRQPC